MNENANKGWNGSSGVTEQSVGADNLQWEKAIKLDLGIEGKLFNEQVDFTVDFFRDTQRHLPTTHDGTRLYRIGRTTFRKRG